MSTHPAPTGAANANGNALAIAPPGTVARQEFGAQQIQRSAETAASAVAAQATAMVQARYVMALQRPRDMDEVRARLLREVERPGFAEAAWFRKPIGQGVEGLSVRFAEAAARCLGNISSDPMVVFEDDRQRIVRLLVTDLESNVTYSKDIVVVKTVERNRLRDGQTALQVRTNSRGQATYIVEATDDEVLAKENSLISKAFRNAVERILPGDIKDECRVRIKAIRSGDVAKDPDAARKKVADAFAGIGVMPAQLKEYLGHDLATCSPAEIQDLRDLYSAIHTGEATWAEALEARGGEEKPEEPPKKPLEAAKERLRASTRETAPPPITEEPKPEEVAGGPCKHTSLWRIAAHTDPGRKLVCPDCSGEFTPAEISAARKGE